MDQRRNVGVLGRRFWFTFFYLLFGSSRWFNQIADFFMFFHVSTWWERMHGYKKKISWSPDDLLISLCIFFIVCCCYTTEIKIRIKTLGISIKNRLISLAKVFIFNFDEINGRILIEFVIFHFLNLKCYTNWICLV